MCKKFCDVLSAYICVNQRQRSCFLLSPGQRSPHCLLPHPIHLFAAGGVEGGLPCVIGGPSRAQLLCIFEKSRRKSRCIGGPQRGCLFHHGTHHRPVQHVRLKLHQQIVDHHATIHAQHLQ